MQTIRARLAPRRSSQPQRRSPVSNRSTAAGRFSRNILRIHYPTLRTGETLFPEWDAHDFGAIQHRGYQRVTRQLIALQNQLRDGRKFEKLARYACANLFFLVLPDQLLREPEAPLGWGLLAGKRGRTHPQTQTDLARQLGSLSAPDSAENRRRRERDNLIGDWRLQTLRRRGCGRGTRLDEIPIRPKFFSQCERAPNLEWATAIWAFVTALPMLEEEP